jgi:non-ribosomal peptide synthetase component F
MMTAADRASVITEFNSTYFSRPQPQRIDQIFESYVELTPDALAVVDEARALSFQEINASANQLARILKRRGACAGELIGVPLGPGIEAVVAAIAVLKAGAAYIAGAPSELRRYTLGSRLGYSPRMFIVASRAEIASRLDAEQIIAFDADADEISNESKENLQRSDTTAGDLACSVLGAERRGQCHCILLEHRNITSMVSSLDERLHFTRFDVWSHAHPMSSEIALVELWGSLLSGSQIAVVPAGVTRSAGGFCHFLAQHGITVLNQKPSEFLQWINMARMSPRHSLHTVMLTGEPLRAAALKAWFDIGRRWPQIIYLYGRCGITVAGACSKVTPRDALCRSGEGLAGVPLSCSRLYVLDRHRQPVPIGMVGDIYIAGDSVAREYTGSRQRRERMTDPFILGADSLLYNTGDKGFWTAEGRIELVACNK